MSEDDLKSIISTYQKKCFDLFNSNVIYETQINQLNKEIENLKFEIETLNTNKTKRSAKEDQSF